MRCYMTSFAILLALTAFSPTQTMAKGPGGGHGGGGEGHGGGEARGAQLLEAEVCQPAVPAETPQPAFGSAMEMSHVPFLITTTISLNFPSWFG